MASNPMQRQKRVSFLLGMLVMLIIAAIVIALLFMQLINLKKEQDAIKAAERTVYVVSEDVSSGSGIHTLIISFPILMRALCFCASVSSSNFLFSHASDE